MKVQATFWNYSFGNVQLIIGQRPEATHCAGFNTWKKLGRCVKKGEKGIAILAPVTFTKTVTDPETGEEREVKGLWFKTVYTFDISQTDGKELPEVCHRLEGDDGQGLYGRLETWARSRGITIEDGDLVSNLNGYYSPEGDRICLNQCLSPTQRAKTLAHEIAHRQLQHNMAEYAQDRGRCELEAESAAFVILSVFGIDAGDYSFGYVASWGKGPQAIKTLKAIGQRVQKVAQEIISAVAVDEPELTLISV